jgi:phage/plasmid-like protein (TIGR03299 family)
MSHEIDETAGKPAFAFDAAEGQAWHRLGHAIPDADAKNPRNIAEIAGALYTVSKEDVFFMHQGKKSAINNRIALVRSDTGAALEVLSDSRYNVVQPIEYFEAFRDSLAKNNLRISSAGVLKGGRIVFVNAKLDKEFGINVMGLDETISYLCMGGGYDGTMASFGYVSNFRTVCWNTLSANLAQTQKGEKKGSRQGLFRMPHTAPFDGEVLGSALGLLGKENAVRADVFNTMAGRRAQGEKVKSYFAAVLGVKDVKDEEKMTAQQVNKMNALIQLYQAGPGADLASAKGTWYGALNAVTHYVDHVASARDTTDDGVGASRFASAQFGTGAAMKAKALELAMKAAAVPESMLLAA